MKKEWGINDVWNELVSPRFKRMNEKTGTQDYGCERTVEGKKVFQTHVPDKDAKGFSKKRIDHRHHAMDALVIALASRNIVNYLSNESANNAVLREDLKRKLCGKGEKLLDISVYVMYNGVNAWHTMFALQVLCRANKSAGREDNVK